MLTLRRCALLTAALAVPVVGVAVGTSASAQSDGTRTVQLIELQKGSTFVHVHNSKTSTGRAARLGDLLAFTNPLADAGGRRVGKQAVTCVVTTGSSNFLTSTMTCQVVVTLRDGTLVGQLNLSPGAKQVTGAVTGGTGAYAGARGTVVSSGGDGATDTYTLLP